MPTTLVYDPKAIRRVRVERGLAQEEIARLARVSRQALGYLERGMTEPRARTLARLATALQVEVGAFFRTRNP
jgi:transcriptional regulator with XRE-family HTH domain